MSKYIYSLLTILIAVSLVVYFYTHPEQIETSNITPKIETPSTTTRSINLATPPPEVDKISVQLGHSSYVNSVAFSPDGRLALSGSWDNTLKLWEVKSGREIRSFNGHSSIVYSVAFSPDGRLALSGSYKEMKLWEVKSGREIRFFNGHSSIVYSVAFSPDGRLALLGSRDKTLKLWEVKSGREIRSFNGHSDWVGSVAFSPDGRLALSGSHDNTLKLWEVKSGREIRSFNGHSDDVWSVAFSPDGRLALSGSEDGSSRLWNVQTGEEVAQMVSFLDGEWATVTGQNYYVASAKGEQYINVISGNQSRSIQDYPQYQKFYHRPDIVQLALQLEEPEPPSQEPWTLPAHRFALIIGNSQYQYYSKLDNAVNDAKRLAQVLKKLGFKVTLATNLKLTEMKVEFRKFRKQLRQHKQAVGLFYFAGHGTIDGDFNYLLPIGTNSDLMQEWGQSIHVSQIDEWKQELETTAMKTSYIFDMMKAAGNQVNLIFLDACRTLPFTNIRGLRTGQMALPQGLNVQQANSGTLIAYAASSGQAAADGTGNNSPYIKHLVKWMQEPNMRLVDILRKVRQGVETETKGQQKPDYDDELNEPFYFIK